MPRMSDAARSASRMERVYSTAGVFVCAAISALPRRGRREKWGTHETGGPRRLALDLARRGAARERIDEHCLLLRVAAETQHGRPAALLERRHEVEELRPEPRTGAR